MTTKHNPDNHHRQSSRLKEYDYAQAGAYFVTICTRNRDCLFGEIIDGEMRLNDAGRMVQSVWDELLARFPDVELDTFAIMPNHVHGIIIINCRGESRIRPGDYHESNLGDHKDRPYGTTAGSVGRIIQAFKSIVTHEYVVGVRQNRYPPFHGRLWQRNYYEHVIRDEEDMRDIRQYILDNPARWTDDENHPDKIKRVR